MARHASAIKAARQAKKRNERNRTARSRVRTAIKNLRQQIALSAGKKGEAKDLPALLTGVQKVLMKAASKKLIKKETASRQIARLSQAIHRVSAGT